VLLTACAAAAARRRRADTFVQAPAPIPQKTTGTELLLDASRALLWLYVRALRALSAGCQLAARVLGIAAGALSFTVIFAVMLSFASAGFGLASAGLDVAASLAETGGAYLLTARSGAEKGRRYLSGGAAAPLGERAAPEGTFEELEPFFCEQLIQARRARGGPPPPPAARPLSLSLSFLCTS
jgi:hypothetical protein